MISSNNTKKLLCYYPFVYFPDWPIWVENNIEIGPYPFPPPRSRYPPIGPMPPNPSQQTPYGPHSPIEPPGPPTREVLPETNAPTDVTGKSGPLDLVG